MLEPSLNHMLVFVQAFTNDEKTFNYTVFLC